MLHPAFSLSLPPAVVARPGSRFPRGQHTGHLSTNHSARRSSAAPAHLPQQRLDLGALGGVHVAGAVRRGARLGSALRGGPSNESVSVRTGWKLDKTAE